MRGRLAWIGALALFVALLAWRAVQLDSLPAFEFGLPDYRRPSIRANRLEFAHPCGGGLLRVEAAQAFPGHETVGYFRLGPSTFLDLRGVRATFTAPSEVGWQVIGGRARLGAEALEFVDGPTLRSEDGETVRHWREVEIDLAAGRISVR